MSDKPITKVPARGQAWLGAWKSRVLERLRARGFDSVAEFAESKPTASLIALAQELSTDREAAIDHADVAAEQLAQLWQNEAIPSGPEALQRMARRVLVGELHQGIPEGWRRDWTVDSTARDRASRLSEAASVWINTLPDESQEAARRVFSAILDEARAGRIAEGWLPANADDPILVEIFAQHWWRSG